MSNISQDQYDYLMGLKKTFSDDKTIDLSKWWTKELISVDGRETFLMDYKRGAVEFKKMSLNTRYRTTIVLARLCTLKRHTNPDGTVFPAAHVHFYDEEYADAIAHPVSIIGLTEPFTSEEAFIAFTNFCKISNPKLQAVIGA